MAKLTVKKALTHLEANRQITTGMLDLLNMSMDTWLRYAQAPKELQDRAVDAAISMLKNKRRGNGQIR